MVGRREAAIGLAGALGWLGCAFAGTGDPAPDHWQVSEIQDRKIGESSGLARSRRHPGVFWTHNDSGDSARFFAIDASGNVLAEFAVDGASHEDWEDIAIDDDGFLYLGDVGNNSNDRDDLVVYRVAEPDPAAGDGHVGVERRLRFAYADQGELGDRGRMNFDSEAIFSRAGQVYIFTKHRSDTATQLYRLDPEVSALQQLEPIARFDLGGEIEGFLGNTTAADLSPDGSRLALLTYRGVFLSPPQGALTVLGTPFVRLVLDSLDTGHLTTSDASDYLGIRLKHLPTLASALETD